MKRHGRVPARAECFERFDRRGGRGARVIGGAAASHEDRKDGPDVVLGERADDPLEERTAPRLCFGDRLRAVEQRRSGAAERGRFVGGAVRRRRVVCRTL